MARKADTTTAAAKPAKAKTTTKTTKTTKPRAAAAKSSAPAILAAKPVASKSAAKADTKKSAARARKNKSTLEAVRTPILAASTQAKSGSAKVKTKVKNEAKKAMKAAKKQARGLMSDVHVPSMPHIPDGVSDAFKSIGTQIAGALNTDVGRVMMAELLIYVAKSLTKAAASTEAGEDAKSALLNAGAKIGAVAADAGAKMVETGHSAAEAGSKMMDAGRKAAGEGADSAVSSARDLVRDVAQVAVGAVGGAVVDAAKKAIAGRGRKAAASPAGESKPGAPRSPSKTAGGPARSNTTSESGSSETAPATAANAGHRPPAL